MQDVPIARNLSTTTSQFVKFQQRILCLKSSLLRGQIIPACHQRELIGIFNLSCYWYFARDWKTLTIYFDRQIHPSNPWATLNGFRFLSWNWISKIQKNLAWPPVYYSHPPVERPDNTFNVGDRSMRSKIIKNLPGTKALLKGWISGLIVYLLSSILAPESGSAFLIRIRIRIQHTFFINTPLKFLKRKKSCELQRMIYRNYSNIVFQQCLLYLYQVAGTLLFSPRGLCKAVRGRVWSVYYWGDERRKPGGKLRSRSNRKKALGVSAVIILANYSTSFTSVSFKVECLKKRSWRNWWRYKQILF
jgi:hypothetical protein